MTKEQFRELVTRYLADSGILVTVDPTGRRNFDEMTKAVDRLRDRLARKLFERYEYCVVGDDFYADVDGVGKDLKPDSEEDKY